MTMQFLEMLGAAPATGPPLQATSPNATAPADAATFLRALAEAGNLAEPPTGFAVDAQAVLDALARRLAEAAAQDAEEAAVGDEALLRLLEAQIALLMGVPGPATMPTLEAPAWALFATQPQAPTDGQEAGQPGAPGPPVAAEGLPAASGSASHQVREIADPAILPESSANQQTVESGGSPVGNTAPTTLEDGLRALLRAAAQARQAVERQTPRMAADGLVQRPDAVVAVEAVAARGQGIPFPDMVPAAADSDASEAGGTALRVFLVAASDAASSPEKGKAAIGDTVTPEANRPVANGPSAMPPSPAAGLDRIANAPPARLADAAQPMRQSMTEALANQAARSIRYLTGRDESSLTVRLIPESLGEMRIEVHTAANGLAVRLASANPMVRGVLEAQAQTLREALQREGIDVCNIEVAAELARHGGQQRANDGETQRTLALSRSAGLYRPWRLGQVAADDGPTRRVARHYGAVDVFV